MTVGSFFLGFVLFVAGFFAVWRTRILRDYVGDLSTLVGAPEHEWLDWKLLGVIAMLLGILIMFGIFPLLWQLTVGSFFRIEL